jgi:hypothetical protein
MITRLIFDYSALCTLMGTANYEIGRINYLMLTFFNVDLKKPSSPATLNGQSL